MNLQLIQGQFSAGDAIDILTKMVEVKIKFHEAKILSQLNEEDIKMRENRIKQLQKELVEIRNFITSKEAKIEIRSLVQVE
ncbi:MAG TPA: hypothetical protein PKM63_01410 [Panacibacter sp.]|nr:hypothetical protein [Panacibacter sp.]HNP42912.1 hypothetical protein [Panacibacter sp.]